MASRLVLRPRTSASAPAPGRATARGSTSVGPVDGPHGGQYFAARPEVASAPRRVRLALPDLTLDLTTDRGVFAADGVDQGTRFLLGQGPAVPAGATTLVDLGCGYGPIALALARRHPGATVWAVDVNERAVALCAANAAAAGLGNVRSVTPDAPELPASFAGIWSNPPVRIG